MSAMFWAWLGVIVITAVIEMVTTELISIWFTFGAIVPFILSACNAVGYEWQILLFVVISAILIISLRKITKKWLLRNVNAKTNVNALVGQRFRMSVGTDFDTLGVIKVKDLEWRVKGDKMQTIEAGSIVEVVEISGNKLIVKEVNVEEK